MMIYLVFAACGGARTPQTAPVAAVDARVADTAPPDAAPPDAEVAVVDAEAPALDESVIDAKRVTMLETLDRAIGARPASLGPLLDNLALGTRITPAIRAKLDALMNGSLLSPLFDDRGGVLDGVILWASVEEIRALDTEAESRECEHVRVRLASAWGPPTIDDTWLDPRSHQRAELDTSCMLHLTRYLDPSDWVAALPIPFIGKNARELEAKHPPDDDVHMNLNAYYWFAGVGQGSADTDVEAIVAGTCGPRGGPCNPSRTIIGLHITTTTDPATAASIRNALGKRLHAKPKKQPDDVSEVWQWRGTPRARLRYDEESDELDLEIGKSGD